MKKSILLVDDDSSQREVIGKFLQKRGFLVLHASNAEKALECMKEKSIDLLISDVQMPGISGLELMKRTRELKGGIPILLITAYGDIRDAVSAVKDGALSYLEKPIDLEEILQYIDESLGSSSEKEDGDSLPPLPEWFIAKSEAMKELLEELYLFANSDVRVLITGENGSGKEVVADLIHRWSKRANEHMIKVNCAAIPNNLLESELFGHERGAFTGAEGKHLGHFSRAHGGTLFLDEIGELPMDLQAKLLRVTEQGTFIPLGGEEVSCDVRILAASNRNLEEDVARGLFREDLFFRLNTFEVFIPPLRERREDIIPLAKYFASSFGGGNKRFSPAVTTLLNTYPWRGNVRELRNAMERASLMSSGSGVIVPEHLPKRLRKTIGQGKAELSAARGSTPPMEEVERLTILQSLEKNDFNRTKTAKSLGISRRSLTYKIKKLKEEGYTVDRS